jgi:3-methyladenine DNA glycosylase AlkD
MTRSLLARIRSELERVADPSRAAGMQAYMKSAMPYLGVSAVPFRKTMKPILAELSFDSFEEWRAAVLAIWRGAKFREERYAAVELTGARCACAFQTPEALPLYEQLIVEGAWWDLVDEIATHRIRELLRAHGAPVRRAMLAWSRSDDLWKRRSSIICQVGLKGSTDLDLLYRCLEPNLPSKEFFLRKAIGWALREYAWTDPDEVVRYVRAHEGELSGLSQREALKNVGKMRSGRGRGRWRAARLR